MQAARQWGAAVAEFPLTVGAARTARELGMPVVMGAPNVLRGGSHSGNVDAEELIRLGLCTSLASDYLPSSLLAAVFLLVERGVTTLSRAVGLVTSGPADVPGWTTAVVSKSGPEPTSPWSSSTGAGRAPTGS